ncbi:alginate O-acetyltransferase AlgX-related protein [Vreelandella sp. EE7]
MKDWEVKFKDDVANGNHVSVVELAESTPRENTFSPLHYTQFISSLFSLGLKERGAEVVEEALRVFPNNLSLRIFYAERSMSSSEWDNAIRGWKYIIDNFDKHPEGVLWRLAKSYIYDYQFYEARCTVEKIRTGYGDSQKLEDLVSLIDSTEAQKYIVNIYRKSQNLLYYIDEVQGNKEIGKIHNFLKYHLYGWVQVPQNEHCFLIIRNSSDQVSYHELNVERPDVKKYFESKSCYDTELQCGFDYYIDVTSGVHVGVQIGENQEWLFQIELQDLSNVLEGKEGWFFLDNDINKSVDQFLGKSLLTEEMSSAWMSYADRLLEYQRKFNLVYLIASAKEAVVPQYYPYEKASITPFDQATSILKDKKVNSFSPTEVLSKKEGTYYKTDTHWSDYGAYLTYLKVMKESGFEKGIVEVDFEELEAIGDLGSKFYPVKKSLKKVHTYSGPKAELVFGNEVPGSGAIKIWENPDAYYSKTALLFGDSFMRSGCLVNYFTYSFGRVVFINLPGSLIENVVSHESPALLVVETNDRYLLKPGAVYKKISAYESPVFTKTASLSMAKKKDVEQESLRYPKETFYSDEMSRIFDNIYYR